VFGFMCDNMIKIEGLRFYKLPILNSDKKKEQNISVVNIMLRCV